MDFIGQTYLLLLFSLGVLAVTDFDFLEPWTHTDLPKGCYTLENNEVKCYRISHDKTTERSVAADHCKQHNGRLASYMSDSIWNGIWNDVIIPNNTIYNEHVWLGAKVRAYQTTLSDSDGQALSFVDNTFWQNARIGEALSGDRCVFAQTQPDKANWIWNVYTSCVYSTSLYYICEYTGPFGCSIGDLYTRVSHANFKPRLTPETVVHHNAEMNIECWDGYQMKGPGISKCSWRRWIDVPECNQGCPLPETRRHAQLVSLNENKFFAPEEKAVFICDEYHYSDRDYAQTHFSLVCGENGEWSDLGIECVPGDTFETVDVNMDDPYNLRPTLHCDVKLHHNSVVKWRKNGIEVSNSRDYHILQNTSLIVTRATEKTTGLYSCINYINDEPNIGNIFYHLIGKERCASTKPETGKKVLVDEGDNVLFGCRNSSYEMKWFKDGSQIWSNVRHSILPSGELFLNKVHLSDVGIYTCHAIERGFNKCELNLTHELMVTASARSMCKGKDVKTGISVSELVQQPWLVSIWQSDKTIPFCYGSIIDNQWVLTTAVCLSRFRGVVNFSVYVKFGAVGSQKTVYVDDIKVHPRYRRNFPDNNIALAKLEGKPIKFSHEVYPACVPEVDLVHRNSFQNPYRLNGTVAGWGSLESDYGPLEEATADKMAVASSDECLGTRVIGDVGEDVFCADRVVDTDPTYAGDAGSPFLVTWKGRMHVMGVYSWGQRSAGKGRYDYFTNVTHHHEWIQDVIYDD